MKIRDVLRVGVVTAEPRETLAEVARRMDWLELSCLPVFDHGRMVGIITERDITRATAAGAQPKAARAGQYMTAHPVTVGPDDQVEEATRLMLAFGVRHLPVVQRGVVVGIISARDLLALAA